ncbi:WXG100 family type VII secretion target [Dactylosporangium sp. CA-139114]|uniref:WXG100 family type VII secretion target n=1 Tax=unclassified Dactylosporangium TaxID=2621675 RepID=UPI0033283C38|nr:WXG100 family type VII secretion target [Dactylosporangium thailandense]
MVQTTQAQQAELSSAAQRFEQVNGELQGMLNTLMRELEVTRAGWQGAGGRTFEQVKLAFKHDQGVLNRNLLETSEGLRTAGRNYGATDAEAAGAMRRAGNADLSALGG